MAHSYFTINITWQCQIFM